MKSQFQWAGSQALTTRNYVNVKALCDNTNQWGTFLFFIFLMEKRGKLTSYFNAF